MSVAKRLALVLGGEIVIVLRAPSRAIHRSGQFRQRLGMMISGFCGERFIVLL